MLKHWKIILTVGIMILSLGSSWFLYEETQSLSTQLSTEKIKSQLCAVDYEKLKDELDELKISINLIQEENDELIAKIDRSKDIIRTINNDRELLLQRLDTSVPENCEEIFQWMRNMSEIIVSESNE